MCDIPGGGPGIILGRLMMIGTARAVGGTPTSKILVSTMLLEIISFIHSYAQLSLSPLRHRQNFCLPAERLLGCFHRLGLRLPLKMIRLRPL